MIIPPISTIIHATNDNEITVATLNTFYDDAQVALEDFAMCVEGLECLDANETASMLDIDANDEDITPLSLWKFHEDVDAAVEEFAMCIGDLDAANAVAEESQEKIPVYVVDSDDFFEKKGDKNFQIAVPFDPSNHYKGLNHEEKNRIKAQKETGERTFLQPPLMREFYEKNLILNSTVEGFKSHTYHSADVTEFDPSTGNPIRIIKYRHQLIEMEVHILKEEHGDSLAVAMEDGKRGRKRSVKTVDGIATFYEAYAEIRRHDGAIVTLYYGGARSLLCAAGTTSAFLKHYYTHTYDILCNPWAMVDFVCSDNKEYVHYMLFARRVGTSEYSIAHRKNPSGLQGLTCQFSFFKELVCGILFLFVSINLAPDSQDLSRPPLCIPLHPQAQAGHVAMTNGHLYFAIFSNAHGDTISNNVLGAAGAKSGTLCEDVRSLACKKDVDDWCRRRARV